MTKLVRIATAVAILLLLAGGATWLWAQYISHRFPAIVWENPIQLKNGFAIAKSFTIPTRGTNYLGIRYNKETIFNPSDPVAFEDFSVAFEIRSAGLRVAQGTGGGDSSFIIHGKGYTILLLGKFEAEGGKSYDLNLQVVRATPNLISTTPTIMILSNFDVSQKEAFEKWRFDNYARTLTIVAIISSIPFLWNLLPWIRRRKEVRAGQS